MNTCFIWDVLDLLVTFPAQNQSTNYTQEIRTAFLQQAFALGGLVNVSDEELLLWLKVRLRPLMVDLAPGFVTSLASIGGGRRCNVSQEM